ncbi:beta-N-acetylhexosaminidase [Streptomyces sp. NPDC060194]|uniref:beta-N-acetylhexosaminidase n=1 Tax=Streptomyces sp. NPDC060194 TaxID=3347069 RepID=UPI0036616C95
MPSSRSDFDLVPLPDRVHALPGRFPLRDGTGLRVGPGAEPAAALLAAVTGLRLPAAKDGPFVLALDPALSGLGEEGYGLTVGPDGAALRAGRLAGLLRGVQTVRQLLDEEGHLPGTQITDIPRYAWRGAMLDVARHFQPVEYLKRYVDLLAFHKMNVFHLHLTDDQGWRMPVPAYPLLTEVGGWRTESAGDGRPHGGAYTKAELLDLVEFARARGVTVVPEIEMPGHMRSALAAYPELGNRPEVRLDTWTEWGVCENILGVQEETLEFCRVVLDEVMDVFPSPYIHIGGDECPIVEWQESPRARERAAALGLDGPEALHGWFMGEMAAHLTARGRKPLGWTETGHDLPGAFTVAAWRDAAHGLAAARRGQDVVMTPHLSTYLDYRQSDHPEEPAGQPGPVVDLRAVYETEAVPSDWEPEAAARLLGAQAQLWTEYAPTAAHIEYLAFPRMSALAEATWSTHRDFAAFSRRMRHHRTRLTALGVTGRRPARETSGA